jgi:hypothetical protein
MEPSEINTASPRINILPAHFGPEWIGLPQVERVHRLHVVMAVDEKRWLVRACAQPFGVDDRMPGRGHDLRALHSHRPQVIGQPLRRAGDIALVLGLGADTGNGQ